MMCSLIWAWIITSEIAYHSHAFPDEAEHIIGWARYKPAYKTQQL